MGQDGEIYSVYRHGEWTPVKPKERVSVSLNEQKDVYHQTHGMDIGAVSWQDPDHTG